MRRPPPLSWLLAFLLALATPLSAHADTKVLTAEGTYTMGEGETMTFAESMALQKAKQMALEQAGTYVESYTKVQNYQLTAEEIQTITGGVLQVEVLEKTRTLIGDGLKFFVKTKATVTTDKIADLAQRIKGKNVAEEYKKLQEDYAKLGQEVERWKQLVAKAPPGPEREAALDQIREREKAFAAAQRSEESFFQRLIAGDALVREAMEIKEQLDRLYQATIQGYAIQLGQAKSSILAGSANLKITVPITLQVSKHLFPLFHQATERFGGTMVQHNKTITVIRVAEDIAAQEYFIDRIRNTEIVIGFQMENGGTRSCLIRNNASLGSQRFEPIHRIYPAYRGGMFDLKKEGLHYAVPLKPKDTLCSYRHADCVLALDESSVTFGAVVSFPKEEVQSLQKVSAQIFTREHDPKLLKQLPCGLERG